MANKKIGFIGVGLMGHGMAKHLVEKGFSTCVLGHRNRAPVEDLVKRGAREAKDVASLVSDSDFIILCVTGSPQVEDLVYRKGGILETSHAGQILVDTSTRIWSGRSASFLRKQGGQPTMSICLRSTRHSLL